MQSYIGEHLLPGEWGHFLVVVSFVTTLLAMVSFGYAWHTKDTIEKKRWIRFARALFAVETIAVIGCFIILYYILSHHYFEYKYAWQHSDRSLSTAYLFSCFWEGQEGSFLLWTLWNCILGWAMIKYAKEWEAGVMTIMSFVQFCLSTMIIGLWIKNIHIGSNPFTLLRTDGILNNAPIFQDLINGGFRSDYLSLIKDGTGLNTLLQNYWMVIHPPILFLGFASTIIPFSFAFVGLINKNNEWTKAVLPWSIFSVAILGLGISMGAAWAYESLSFGGYWAWDPVENASLVPWILMVAGLHVNLIYKSSSFSLRSTYLFYLLSFCLVLYSTFLTRSGILGDTSVHAFTDLGMNMQLLLFVLVFTIPTLFIFCFRYKHIPAPKKEEQVFSREFWLFIGSLVLFLSAFIITCITSLPVFNKMVQQFSFLQHYFKNSFSQPEDVEYTHNQIQILIACILGILTAIGQYLKYGNTTWLYFWKKIRFSVFATVISVVILILIGGRIDYVKHGQVFKTEIVLALCAAIYSFWANGLYIWVVLKGKISSTATASIAHIGFAMILIGILISSSNKKILSWNESGISMFQSTTKENPAENVTLFQNKPIEMGNYQVTYVRDSTSPLNTKRYFIITFKDQQGHIFTIHPNILKNNKGNQGFSANPDAKHYWNKDIFVYITSFLDESQTSIDTSAFQKRITKLKDTLFYSGGYMVLQSVSVNPIDEMNRAGADTTNETGVFLNMLVVSKDSMRYMAHPGIIIVGNSARILPDTVVAENLIVRFDQVVDSKNNILQVSLKETKPIEKILTLKVLEFPYIFVLWIGIIVMVIGSLLSMILRLRKKI